MSLKITTWISDNQERTRPVVDFSCLRSPLWVPLNVLTLLVGWLWSIKIWKSHSILISTKIRLMKALVWPVAK